MKAIDNTFELPVCETPSEAFAYIADYNSIKFYETDGQGVIKNEIPVDFFFCDVFKSASPEYINTRASDKTKFDGVLFFGTPADYGLDVDDSNGQFETIVKDMVKKSTTDLLARYINCAYKFRINLISPLYNSNKYTKATNSTGVEISYSIWI